MIVRVLISVIILAVLSGCSKSEKEDSTSSLSAELESGKAIVKANCKVCHAQGINGAPVIGNKVMWDPRKEKGLDALTANAISGVGLMPPKGGKTHLSEEEFKLAIRYMLSQVE